MHSTTLLSQFKPIRLSDLETLRPFYDPLNRNLTDLNPFMMVAWRRALDFRFLIENDVLYVLASWNGGSTLWGPPLGEKITVDHIRRAFQLLSTLDPGNPEPRILYLWDHYCLWNDLLNSSEFVLCAQGTEYVYDSTQLAELPTSTHKKKRRAYRNFKQTYCPMVVEYSAEFAPGCLDLLEKWVHQKNRVVSDEHRRKFGLEQNACADALRERLPLAGVVALVEGEVQAFSIGAPHGRTCFNCMFEKTNLDMPEASAFIFPELAKRFSGVYSEINAGEDWGIGYLAVSKRLWKPTRIQSSYYLKCNNQGKNSTA